MTTEESANHSDELIVGSSNQCDVILRDSSVDPHHLRLRRINQVQFQIVDLNTEHGTYVRGQKITETIVQRGDIIQIGSRPIEVRWLISHFGTDMPQRMVEYAGTALVIGSTSPADIILPYPDISAQHAELVVDPGGNVMISDLGSIKGTFLNGIQVRSRMQLSIDDSLYLGSFRVNRSILAEWLEKLAKLGVLFDDSDPTETDLFMEETQTLNADNMQLSNADDSMEKIRLPSEGSLVIGRDPEADVFINHPSLSWHHAKLIVRSGTWVLVDLSSTNGTFVDGQRVTKVEVTESSWIRLGAVFLVLSDDEIAASQLDPSAMRLDVVHLGKKLPSGKTLLDDISFSIYPGEVVALMGPSGAGKTALLECLTGKRQPTKGKVYLNGESLHKNLDEFQHSIGYVPQEDVMHRDLTVYETLYYAAKMRLPRDLPEQTIVETVEHVLMRMGLANIRDSIIGDEQVRGISGGQRKRVNIALELITEPSLIFLDEPTSGLDGTSTLEILQILRTLANNGGKTIILTIHQPRIEAYKLVDNLILLVNGGRLVFYGPAYPDAPEYFSSFGKGQPYISPGNPADYIIDLLDSSKQPDGSFSVDWMREFEESTHHRRFVQDRLSVRKELQSSDEIVYEPQAQYFFHQYKVLCRRYYRRRMRDRSSLLIQLAQTPVIGGILGWLFLNEGYAMATKNPPPDGFKLEALLNMMQLENGIHPSLFLMGAAAFWFGCSNVAREIVSERPVYLRERRSGLPIGAYLASIFTYQFGLAAVQTLLIITIMWGMVGFTANFLAFWGVLQLIAGCGIALGLLVSASSKTEVTAISVIPLLLLPQLMLGGFIKLYGYLLSDGLQGRIADIMPIRWAFEALTVLEYNNLQRSNDNVRDLSDVIGFSASNLSMSCGALVGFTVLFLGMTLLRLQFWESKAN